MKLENKNGKVTYLLDTGNAVVKTIIDESKAQDLIKSLEPSEPKDSSRYPGYNTEIEGKHGMVYYFNRVKQARQKKVDKRDT